MNHGSLRGGALGLLLGLIASRAAAGDTADQMRARIAELEKEQAAMRALAPEQKWELIEQQITIYEDRVYAGDLPSEMFLKLSRDNLRDARRQRFAEKWGPAVLERADAVAELRDHAQRMAELKRVRMLARVRKFPKLVAEVEALLSEEKARHDSHMSTLKQAASVLGGTR